MSSKKGLSYLEKNKTEKKPKKVLFSEEVCTFEESGDSSKTKSNFHIIKEKILIKINQEKGHYQNLHHCLKKMNRQKAY